MGTKEELLEVPHREGKFEVVAMITTSDHNFGSMGSGTVIPHGLYRLRRVPQPVLPPPERQPQNQRAGA